MKLCNNPRYIAIQDRARKYEAKHVRRGFYFEPDHSDTVCRSCLDKLLQSDLVLNGDVAPPGKFVWFFDDPSASHDVMPRCEVASIEGHHGCGRMLLGWLTKYGAENELAWFEGEGFNIRNYEHCYIWLCIENAVSEQSDEFRHLLVLAGIPEPSANQIDRSKS